MLKIAILQAGQAMNALLQEQVTKSDIHPIPAPGGLGFAINSESFPFFDCGLPNSSTVIPDLALKMCNAEEAQKASWFRHALLKLPIC